MLWYLFVRDNGEEVWGCDIGRLMCHAFSVSEWILSRTAGTSVAKLGERMFLQQPFLNHLDTRTNVLTL